MLDCTDAAYVSRGSLRALVRGHDYSPYVGAVALAFPPSLGGVARHRVQNGPVGPLPTECFSCGPLGSRRRKQGRRVA
jgi:hypothetical protein